MYLDMYIYKQGCGELTLGPRENKLINVSSTLKVYIYIYIYEIFMEHLRNLGPGNFTLSSPPFITVLHMISMQYKQNIFLISLPPWFLTNFDKFLQYTFPLFNLLYACQLLKIFKHLFNPIDNFKSIQ